MLFCDRCGKQLNDNAKFCQFCGNHINHLTSSEPNQSADNHYKVNQPERIQPEIKQSYQHYAPQPIHYDKNNPPPVIKSLVKRIKKKAIIEIFLIAIELLCIFILCIGSTLDYIFYIVILGTMIIWNCYVSFKDLQYKKKVLSQPVGVVEHYEKEMKKFLLPNFPLTLTLGGGHKSNTIRIKNYVLLNEELLNDVEKYFLAENHMNGMSLQTLTNEEQARAGAAFTASPTESKETKVIMGRQTIGMCTIVIMLTVFLLAIMADEANDSFYFTAKDYITTYNQTISAHHYDCPLIDFSDIQKSKNSYNELYYEYEPNIANDDYAVLFIKGDTYDNNVNGIMYVVYTGEENDDIPSGIVYQIETLYDTLSYDEIEDICKNVKKSKGFSSTKTSGIYCTYEFDEENKCEIWRIHPSS